MKIDSSENVLFPKKQNSKFQHITKMENELDIPKTVLQRFENRLDWFGNLLRMNGEKLPKLLDKIASSYCTWFLFIRKLINYVYQKRPTSPQWYG